MPMKILELKNLTVRFLGITAVNNISMDVEEGEIRALIGPNGAGKTTILNVITGFYSADLGAVYFRQEKISGLRPDLIAKKGIARTFQKSELFSEMTVMENILVGLHGRTRSSLVNSFLNLNETRSEEMIIQGKALAILESFGLARHGNAIASSLPFGLRRTLEIARAFASDPKMILLDEPAAGMNKEEVRILETQLRRLNEKDEVTILLIEHVMNLVMRVSNQITVVHYGQKIAEGPPELIKNDPSVIKAYLGESRKC